ncbi:hypothetical protein [Streptomyces sp. DH10]|uniref:hypothetical protein n=1 Tax=Streptomyces sp. DH10 TaxID=3040121 RepID=UPI002442019E|nr:hypothetical protein [Streptomyces sp. DH10]MDG9708362.1 hypothetical protein [Streptomyces sp. DH10]
MSKFRLRGSMATGLLAAVAIGAFTAAPAQATGNATAEVRTTAAANVATVMASGKVTVPSNYVYKPSKGSLHDYCTSSPDSWNKADFRGPCARHDLCYAKPGNHKKACDAVLNTQMTQNCYYAYGSANPLRYTCVAIAAGYYSSVVGFGDDH